MLQTSRRSSLADSNSGKSRGGKGPDFGRRMSLSSVGGGRKYGRASEGGYRSSSSSSSSRASSGPVRHIPIVIEASDNESDDDSEVSTQYSGHTRLITRGTRNVPIDYSWSISISDSDRSSLSSGSSSNGDNSLESWRVNEKRMGNGLRGGGGLAERKNNIDNTRNTGARLWSNIEAARKHSATDWKGLKTLTNKIGGKENELVSGNKEAVKNRSSQVPETGREKTRLGLGPRSLSQHQMSTKSSALKNCPVHGGALEPGRREGGGKKQQPSGPFEYLSRQLKSPSLLTRTLTKKGDDKSGNNATGPKNNIVKEKSKQTDAGADTFAPRRPERSSIRRHKSTTTINNSDSDNNNEQQQSFQRRWSFRLPQTIKHANNNNSTTSSSGSNIVSGKMGGSQSGTKQIAPTPPSAKETPEASSSSMSTNPSLTSSSSLTHLPPSSSWGGPLKIPDYFRGILADRAAHGDCDRDKDDDDRRKTDAGKLKRYASHTDLSQLSNKGGLTPALSVPGPALGNFLRTPSSSTSSIPAKIAAESLSAPVSVPGILKTPGRRKLSSNNRVEFLDNLQEKEIPGRHA